MTSPTTSSTPRDLALATQRQINAPGLAILACSFGVILLSAGCSEKESPASSASNSRSAAPAQRAAPAPLWSVDDLDLHDRVQFPEQIAPKSREVADAIASFASALASGNNVTLGGMLAQRDRAVLRDMVDHGDWDRYAQGLSGVRISVLEEQGDSFRLGLGVMSDQIAYLTGWEAKASGGAWTFSGLNIGRIEAEQLELLDGASLELVEAGQRSTVADLTPTVAPPEPEPPSEEGAAPAGGGFGTGGGGGLPTRPSDF